MQLTRYIAAVLAIIDAIAVASNPSREQYSQIAIGLARATGGSLWVIGF